MRRTLLAMGTRRRLWVFWPLALACLAAAWYLVALGIHGLELARFPYQSDYGEGALLNEVHRLLSGQGIYHNDVAPPFIVGNYPPVYPALVAVLQALGLGQGFFAGRLLSGTAILTASVLAGLVVRRVAAGTEPRPGPAALWATALVAAGLMAAQIAIWRWGPLMRVDSLALAFTMAGLYRVASRPERAASAWPWFLLAVLTRQSEIDGLVASLWLLWPHARAQALRLLGLWALGLALAVGGLELGTHGQFLVHIVVYNANHWSLGSAFSAWMTWVFTAGGLPLLLLALGGLPVARRAPLGRLLTGFAGAAWLISVTVGKVGAAVNYFFPSIAAAAMLASLVALVPRRTASLLLAAYLVGIPPLNDAQGLAGQVARSLTAYHDLGTPGFRQLGWSAAKGGRDPAQQSLVALLARTPGPILCENMGALVLAGHQVYFQPFELTQAARDGNWNPAPLVRQAEQGAFPLVVLDFPLQTPAEWSTDRWPPALLEALDHRYQAAGVLGSYHLYVPRSVGPTGTAAAGAS